MSTNQKRDAGKKMVRPDRMTVGRASKHVTPEPMPESLSQPGMAGDAFPGSGKYFPQSGAPGAAPSMSGHRTMDRKGFSPHTGSVSPPFGAEPEDINTIEPGTLEGS